MAAMAEAPPARWFQRVLAAAPFFGMLLSHLTQADLQRERDEILTAKPADVQAMAPVVEGVLKQAKLCVYGNEKKLQDNKQLFDELVKVLP